MENVGTVHDIYVSELGDFALSRTSLVLTTDWGDVALPASVSTAFDRARKSRRGLPDERTTLGKRLKAYERRQLALANAAEGDFTPEEFA